MPLTKFLQLGLSAFCLLTASPGNAEQEDTLPPVFDASGEWIFHVEAPRLLVGDCPVGDDSGYDERVTIRQTGNEFTITIADGATEKGVIDGADYTHTSSDEGVDITGMAFILTTYSRFTLVSPEASVGTTTLDIRFEDGNRCQLDLRFEGELLGTGESRGVPIELRPA